MDGIQTKEKRQEWDIQKKTNFRGVNLIDSRKKERPGTTFFIKSRTY